MTVKQTNASQRTTEELRFNESPSLPLAQIWSENEHLVQFYETDAYLVEMLADFIETGLFAGETCLLFATSDHLAQLEEYMRAGKLDLTSPRAPGAYHTFDADEILAQVMVDGMPEWERFTAVVGSLLARTAQAGQRIRVFGEMVVQLWTQGNPAAAIRLEELWNERRQMAPAFSLLCVYPMHLFAGQEYQEPFTTICQQHSHVLPDERYVTLPSEAERLRAITLLQQKAASLEAEIAERKELERYKEALINLVTHELKTPLTALQGNVQLAQRRLMRLFNPREPLSEEQQQTLEEVLMMLGRSQQQLRMQNRLINDLLDVSRLQEDRLELYQAPCDLLGLVMETVQDFQAAHPSRLITLTLPAHDFLPVSADGDRLRQVLGNYLSNALKFSPATEPVQVSLTQEAETVRVAVTDHGPGLSHAQQQHLWQQFDQEPRTSVQSGAQKGVGLGLYLCQQLISRQQGQVGVESTESQGATFWFTFPLLASLPKD